MIAVMRNLVLFVVVILLGASGCMHSGTLSSTPGTMVDAVKAPAIDHVYAKSLVHVYTKFLIVGGEKNGLWMARGTGFTVTPSVIWTATHVLDVLGGKKPDDAKDMTIIRRWVELIDGSQIEIMPGWRVLAGDTAEASLLTPHGLPCLPVAANAPHKNAPAIVLGFPGSFKTWVSGHGHAETLKTKAPAWLRGMGIDWIEITMPLRVGMSGGPLLVDGKVVGVVSAKGHGHYYCACADRTTIMAAQKAREAADAARKKEKAARVAPKPKAPEEAPKLPEEKPVPKAKKPVTVPPCDDDGL